MKLPIFTILTALLLTGCKANLSQQDELIVIDVNRVYPEKEILLSDIADVSYMQLSEEDNDYLFKGAPLCVTDQTIVVYNQPNGDILFFSKDGQPKSKFNRKGNGPGEYNFIRIGAVCYDEKKDELYVLGNNRIEVLSSTGDYKRTLSLPGEAQVSEMLLFGENSLLIFDNSIQYNYAAEKQERLKGEQEQEKENPTVINNIREPFIRISTLDGQIQNYISLPHDYTVDLTKELVRDGQVMGVMSERFDHILKGQNGIYSHFAENDTMYLYNDDKDLIPFMVQTPSMANMDPIVYINAVVETGNYQFIELITVQLAKNNRFPSTLLVRDKEDGQISTQKIVFDDYKKKEVSISARSINRTQHMKEGVILIPVDEIREAHKNGELSGKLDTFAASISEESENDVLVFLHFK